MKTLLLRLITILGVVSFSAHADTEIITLNSNTANDMLPVVQNLLEPGGKVSVFQGKLVINSGAQNIADIKNVLGTLDKPAKQLLISVKQGGTSTQANKGYSAEGEIQINPNITITHNADGTVSKKTSGQTTISSDSARINVIDNKTSSTDDSSQRVRAMEGYPAHIYIGQQVPIVNTSHDHYGRNQQDVAYENVNQGFYVTANLIGADQVQIEVQTENDKLNTDRQKIIADNDRNHLNNRDNTVIDTQHAGTTTTVRLGQWAPLGGINQAGTQNTSDYLSKEKQTKQTDNSIYIKIDIVE